LHSLRTWERLPVDLYEEEEGRRWLARHSEAVTIRLSGWSHMGDKIRRSLTHHT